MNTGIYEILNTTNGKFYIGSAVNIQKRINEHLARLRRGNHYNAHIQNAFNTCGEESFVFFTIEHVKDVSDLINKEQFWLSALSVCDRNVGYNMAPIAGSQLGFKHSADTRAEMSKSRKGRKLTGETKAKMSIAQKKRKRSPLTEATKKKLSSINMGRRFTEEHKRKISTSHKGRKRGPMSDEHKRKISKSCKGKIPWNKGLKKNE